MKRMPYEYTWCGFLLTDDPTIQITDYYDFRHKTWPRLELVSDLNFGPIPSGMLVRTKSEEIFMVEGKKIVPVWFRELPEKEGNGMMRKNEKAKVGRRSLCLIDYWVFLCQSLKIIKTEISLLLASEGMWCKKQTLVEIAIGAESSLIPMSKTKHRCPLWCR
jgi:hypothetical protein